MKTGVTKFIFQPILRSSTIVDEIWMKKNFVSKTKQWQIFVLSKSVCIYQKVITDSSERNCIQIFLVTKNHSRLMRNVTKETDRLCMSVKDYKKVITGVQGQRDLMSSDDDSPFVDILLVNDRNCWTLGINTKPTNFEFSNQYSSSRATSHFVIYSHSVFISLIRLTKCLPSATDSTIFRTWTVTIHWTLTTAAIHLAALLNLRLRRVQLLHPSSSIQGSSVAWSSGHYHLHPLKLFLFPAGLQCPSTF